MPQRLIRLWIALILPLALYGCVLTPGRFVSTLSINGDRSFAFSYKGEVIALDPKKDFGKGLGDLPKSDDSQGEPGGETESKSLSFLRPVSAETAKAAAETETRNKAIAEALSKEYGYRSVVYQGKGVFLIDYAISGRLTHNFVFPFNADAEAVFPFLVIELRANNSVRVKAPGFANDSSGDKTGMGSEFGAASKLDGIFTLDTDAEIVSQNNEDGASRSGGRQTIRWRATPLTKDAPSAVLRMRAQ